MTFRVVGLDERPLLGGSLCCAVPAGELIVDELRSWPTVTSVHLEESSGEAVVVATNRLLYLEDMLEAIRDLGYGVEAVRRRPI